MSHVDRVKSALTVIPGGKFTLDQFDTYFNGNGDVLALNRGQLSKAIRAQKTVTKTNKAGVYKIRGRRVFP